MEEEAYLAIQKEVAAQPNEKAALAYLLYEAEKIPDDFEGRLALAFLYNETLFAYQSLSADAVNPLFKALGEEVEFEQNFAQMNECLQKEDYGSAEVLLSLIWPFCEKMASFMAKDLEHHYVYFETMMDQFLYAFHHHEETAKIREIPYNIAQVYYVKGFLLDEENQNKEALAYLSKALQFFPSKMAYRLEYLEAEEHVGKIETIRQVIVEDFGYLHEANEAAILYGQLATIAMEEKSYEEAYILAMLGLTFAEKEEEKKTMEDLAMAAMGLLKNKVAEMTPEKLIAFLDEHEIPLGADPSFLDYLQKGILHLSDSLHEYDSALALCENFISLSGRSPESLALKKSISSKKDGAQA